MTPIAYLPRSRKPRERLWRDGVASLTLEDLLAVVIGSGTAGVPVLELAGRVASVLGTGDVGLGELSSIPGIGPAKAAELLAALSLAGALEERRGRQRLDSPAAVHGLCRDLTSLPQEQVAVLYLNVRNGLIAREVVSVGTATASLVHPREVFRPAILRNASHIALAHTHPSGDPSPSPADRQATKRIAQAGSQLGIELVDHVVCSAQRFFSFRQECPELFPASLS